jgi:hypothetical protein
LIGECPSPEHERREVQWSLSDRLRVRHISTSDSYSAKYGDTHQRKASHRLVLWSVGDLVEGREGEDGLDCVELPHHGQGERGVPRLLVTATMGAIARWIALSVSQFSGGPG